MCIRLHKSPHSTHVWEDVGSRRKAASYPSCATKGVRLPTKKRRDFQRSSFEVRLCNDFRQAEFDDKPYRRACFVLASKDCYELPDIWLQQSAGRPEDLSLATVNGLIIASSRKKTADTACKFRDLHLPTGWGWHRLIMAPSKLQVRSLVVDREQTFDWESVAALQVACSKDHSSRGFTTGNSWQFISSTSPFADGIS